MKFSRVWYLTKWNKLSLFVGIILALCKYSVFWHGKFTSGDVKHFMWTEVLPTSANIYAPLTMVTYAVFTIGAMYSLFGARVLIIKPLKYKREKSL